MTSTSFSYRLRKGDADAWFWVIASALLCICVVIFSDYGVTWDHTVEHYKRHKGPKTFNFWFGGFNAADAVFTTGHNPFVFFVYYTVWRGLELVGMTLGVVEAYHLFTSLVGVAGYWAAYKLGCQVLPKRWALLSATLLLLTPRWFGHSFTNFKDLPFAVLWLLCLHTLIQVAREPSRRRFLWHGVALGGLLVVRIGGLMFVPISVMGLVIGGLTADAPRWRERCFHGGIAVLLVIAMQYLSYPYLLMHPVDGVVELLSTQSGFKWLGSTLTLGQFVTTDAVPWWYAPIWLLITLPEVVLAGLGVGVVIALVFRQKPTLPMAIICIGLALPLMYVVLTQAPIYDGPRHVLFLVPMISLLGVSGWHGLHERLSARWAVPGLLAATAIWLAGNVISLHPYQTLYFNQFVGGIEGAQGQFTLDYWGTSSKESAQWLSDNDNGSKRLCVVAELRQSWNVYLPDWIIEDELTLAACPAWAHYAYAFSRNDWLSNAAAYAERHPIHWEPVYHIERHGVRVGTIFKNPSPLSGP